MKTHAQGLFRNSQPTLRSNPDMLSPRELEIVAVIMEGLKVDGFSDEQVATRLNIAVGTVRTHIKRIYQKLQAGEYSSEMRWSGATGENWVLNSQPHGKSSSYKTAAL